MIGTNLGDYVLQREIGSGGMGKVYVAEHAALGRRVAVKVLAAGLHDDDAMWRFFNEARAAVQIGHPSIIDVYHFGIDPEGRGYIVMELLAGESLGARLRRTGRLTLPETLRIARRLASALAAAHRAGVIHRDLKPGNVFLARDEESGEERVKLLDFGIAKLVHALAGPVRTRRNLVLGTPAYMPPEQWRSSTAVDHRADLYALGCMIYEMLSGASPFAGDSHVEAVQAHMFRTPAPLGRVAPGTPRALCDLVGRMLAKQPAERPVSAEVVMVELEAVERGLRPQRMKTALVAAAAVAAVAVGAAGLVLAGGLGDGVGASGAVALTVPRKVASEASPTAPPEPTGVRETVVVDCPALRLPESPPVGPSVTPQRSDSTFLVR